MKNTQIVRYKLVATEGTVHDINGKFMFAVTHTDRAIALINNEDWIKGNESWLQFRERTKDERNWEELVRIGIANDLVNAYNEKYYLTGV